MPGEMEYDIAPHADTDSALVIHRARCGKWGRQAKPAEGRLALCEISVCMGAGPLDSPTIIRGRM